MIAGHFVRSVATLVLLGLAACSGIAFGGNPGREFPKESGPLTVPPAAVRDGTAR